ncbi:MAG TPA: sugar transferase [Chloroflexota bacterium]
MVQPLRITRSTSLPSSETRVPRYKRPFDLVLGTILLLVATPIAAIAAVFIKLTSPGPVFFLQERVGLSGRPFVMYKFRTMHHGADQNVHREYFRQYQQGITAPGQDKPIFKLQRDPRITRIGSILRSLALDEIPQLWNVVKGDMSLVGPRPPLMYEVQDYNQRDLARLSVKPGITGLWQIKGRDVVDFATMIDLDLDYINRQSLALDSAIVLATVPALVWAYINR